VTASQPEKKARAARSKLADLMHRIFFPGEHEREQVLIDALEDLGQSGGDQGKGRGRGERAETGAGERELAGKALAACEQSLGPGPFFIFARRSAQLRLLASLPAMDGKNLLGACPALCEAAPGWREPRELAALPLPAEERQALRRFGGRWLVAGVEPRGQRLVTLLLLGELELDAVQRDLLQLLADRLATLLARRYDAWLAVARAEQKEARWLKECPECGECFDPDAFVCPRDDSELEPTFLLDRLLGGRYLLERRLGRGATGAVYAAHDHKTGRPVAVKLLAAGDAMALGRFANEARAGRKLVHANLVQVLDSGTLSRQSAYLVMELLSGRTLRQILGDGKNLPPARVAELFDPFLEGLAHAHDNGVVHRDLKPENIMVVAGPGGKEQVKILDFGLAKLLRQGSGPQVVLTMAGMVIGTLSYMAPEQLAGEAVDQAADLFATGVMVAEALTGQLPFRGENLGQMLRAVATQPFAMATSSPAQEKVAAILGRALEKKPADRYPDAQAFRAELIPALLACEPFA
jgi:hypothetical protein